MSAAEQQSAYTAAELEEFLAGLFEAAQTLSKPEAEGVRRGLAAVRAGVMEYGLTLYAGRAMSRTRTQRSRFGDEVIKRNLDLLRMGRAS